MQKWKRNEIFEAIQAAGLDPREFKLDDDDAENRLSHRWSPSYFVIGGEAGHYEGRSVVGDAPPWTHDDYSWEALLTRVTRWLDDVKKDLDMPDLWAELEREAELLGPGSDDDNTPFTPQEQEEVARRLQELREDAKQTYALSGAQLQALDAKLEYLVEAAGRLGRMDWRGVFVGAMVSFALSTALPPEAARHILLTFLRGIAHLSGLPELPSG